VSDKASIGDRARGVAVQAIPQAKQAGTTAVHGVRQGVEGARGWAAPRLDQAADAITATVAPKVSSALHVTASRVQPATPARTGIRRLMDWRLLLGLGAAVAAAGAAAAFTMRKRYESATADAKDAANAAGSESSGSVTVKQPGGPTAVADEPVTRPEVNGRVGTSRH
jgi:hypothetical protein